MELDIQYLLGQLFGIIAAVATVGAFVYSEKEKTVKLLLIGSCFGAVQFILLGALSGAAITTFGLFRLILSKTYGDNTAVLAMMFVIITIISYFTYEGYLSLLPVFATYIATYALFRYQGVKFRVTLIIPTTLWLIYNFHVGSIGGTIREILILLLHIKVIILSLGFAYRKEVYTLNYDIFVYLYNNSLSHIGILWNRFRAYFYSAFKKFTPRKKSILSDKLSH